MSRVSLYIMFLGFSFTFFNNFFFFFNIQESYSDLDSFGFLLPATMGFFIYYGLIYLLLVLLVKFQIKK